MSYSNKPYNGDTMLEVMREATHIIQRQARNSIPEARHWYYRESTRYPMHNAVTQAILEGSPRNWHQLLLEHPHKSEGDASRIAYTANERKGADDVQTVTSVGKYLHRHFSLPDHTIRDLVARYGAASQFKFVHTMHEMLAHLSKGPGSCMVWRSSDSYVHCDDGKKRHPYEVYDPQYGWHMAVRCEGEDTVGRALCMIDEKSKDKYFVRTYAKPSSAGGYSETDNGMEHWLKQQGYERKPSWYDGTKMAYFSVDEDFMAPYLDGGDKSVSIDTHGKVLVINRTGEYQCCCTGGRPESLEDEDRFDCACCGDSTADDDGYWVERGEETHVCQSCCDNEYTRVFGRRENEYYVHNDRAVWVGNEHYDTDYLGDNNIIWLENGEYEHTDNAVEIDNEWYHIDDERICRTEDTDEFLMQDDACWQCTESGNWYTDSIDCVEWEGSKYHPDHAPEESKETQEEPNE